MNKTLLSLLLLVTFILLAYTILATSVLAAPLRQVAVYPTPTPGPDGRIIYIVQANDSWWRIAAIYSIDLDQLYSLNNATADTVLREGQEVILGFGGPEETMPTEGPSPTPEPLLPTSTPQPGSGTLCILLYHDRSGDSVRQTDEPSIPGGAISVSDRSGEVSLTDTTVTGMDPVCFEELPEGNYTVSVAIPEGYNPTTVMNYTVELGAGSEITVDFGAQPSSQSLAEDLQPGGSNRSPLLGILGALLLLGGVGLGVFATRLIRTGNRS